MRFPAALTVCFSLAAAALGTAACGPSFQAVYEGNRRFEHCYALEENSTAAMPEKSSCWRDWSEHYTFGQTRDRVQYAISRYVALSRAGSAPTDEAMMMAAPGESVRTSNINAPAPSNAFAPPPKVLELSEERKVVTPGHPGEAANVPFIDAGAPAPVAVQTVLPAQVCNDKCGGDYKSCASGCEGDAGPKAKACVACESKYKTCMRTCFK